MRAMVLTRAAARGVDAVERERPSPGRGQIGVLVSACGVCRTDLHVVDGELSDVRDTDRPGHEIVGRVVDVGPRSRDSPPATASASRGSATTCGACEYCRSGRENLCRFARFTGYQIDGGYAEFTVADARYASTCPTVYDDLHAAPLLCAGLIGYRAYRMAGDVAPRSASTASARRRTSSRRSRVHQGREVYAFTPPGDDAGAGSSRATSAPRGPAVRPAAAGAARRRASSSRRSARSCPRRLRASRPAARSSAPAFT